MPVVERTTFLAGCSPAQVLDFCLEGGQLSEDLSRARHALGGHRSERSADQRRAPVQLQALDVGCHSGDMDGGYT